MGGGAGWMETKVRLSTGAFEAMWREHGLRPVLQLADEPRMAGGLAAEAGPYRFTLSDGGECLQPGVLATSLNHLVVRGALRRGTVIRLLEYFAGFFHNQSIIRAEKLDPARQSMLTSSNVGATGFAQSSWMPTPPSASSGGFDFMGALASW